MRNLDNRVVYIPEAERSARGRDAVTRPATPLDAPESIDTWAADAESIPAATIYRLARFPRVTVIYWQRHGSYTVKYDHDGIHAWIDTNNWDSAIQAAYNYGTWN